MTFEECFKNYSKQHIEESGLWRDLSSKTFAKHFWQTATETERERIIGIIKSLPCADCELKDGSHFSNCPKYNEEWLIEEIMAQKE